MLTPATRRATTGSLGGKGAKPGSHWSVQEKVERDCNDVKTLDEADEVMSRDDALRVATTMGAWDGAEAVASSCGLRTQHFPLPPAETGEDTLLLVSSPGCSLCLQCTVLLRGPAALLSLQQKST